MKSLFTGLAGALLLSACSSTGPIAPVENRVNPSANTATSNNGPRSGTAIGGNSIGVGDASRVITPVKDGVNGTQNGGGSTGADGVPVGKSIYFDYNDYTIKAESQDMLRQTFGTQRPRDASPIRVEGNADERGSREFNLALGQKRAESVKKLLLVLGLPEAQLEAVSLGSERPRETCHEERCWAANRRVDLVRLSR